MIPTPAVRKVAPLVCARCGNAPTPYSRERLYETASGDRFCLSCIRVLSRLGDIAADHRNREGYWP